MAFNDWNFDGKKDMIDDYIEYNIYQQSMKNNSSGSSSGGSSGSGCAFWFWFCVIMLILSIITNLD